MIITETPLRISFAGGGTDFGYYYLDHGGYVVSAAIDKSVFVIVAGRFDDQIYINYSKKEIVDSVREIQNCIVREALIIVGVDRGIEITLMADIPSTGTGLGSSSSFAVGILNALHKFKGESVSPEQLAEEACEIEIQRCGNPIGRQDQYIAAFGGLAGFEFNSDSSVRVERFGLSDAEEAEFAGSLRLIYSGVTRQANSILSEQQDQYGQNIETLHTIKAMANRTRTEISNRNFSAIGPILSESWNLKKTLAPGIETDAIAKLAGRSAESGMLGGKLCGAGGGGFWLSQYPADHIADLEKAFDGYRVFKVKFSKTGSRVIFDYVRD